MIQNPLNNPTNRSAAFDFMMQTGRAVTFGTSRYADLSCRNAHALSRFAIEHRKLVEARENNEKLKHHYKHCQRLRSQLNCKQWIPEKVNRVYYRASNSRELSTSYAPAKLKPMFV